MSTQPNNPLHGVTLAEILEYLTKRYSWDEMFYNVRINCFWDNPSIQSSLKFLRKTPWARKKVEEFYIYSKENESQK
jgi:uncharacterized protein (DUF2132 family)